MDQILGGLINLGVGGVMTAALVWFLYHLVTQTMPEQQRLFREEVATERAERQKEHRRLVKRIDAVATANQRRHEVLMDRLDMGFEALVNEITLRRPTPAPPGHVTRPGPGPDPGAPAT